jgi:hypothetical protein
VHHPQALHRLAVEPLLRIPRTLSHAYLSPLSPTRLLLACPTIFRVYRTEIDIERRRAGLPGRGGGGEACCGSTGYGPGPHARGWVELTPCQHTREATHRAENTSKGKKDKHTRLQRLVLGDPCSGRGTVLARAWCLSRALFAIRTEP